MSTASPVDVAATEADNRGAIVAALMLAIGLAAIDATIVATAVPQIVADLGGFSLFPWIFSIYLLTQAVTVPIYGRLSDVFGRKPVLLVGIAGFLVGSVLCAVAWSMVTLIIFRGLQGLAAGAILPTTTTIVGDLYEPAERGKVQGWISSVWGVSAIARPDARRLLRRVLDVARHLLAQPADRCRRRVADPPPPARACRAPHAPHRLRRRAPR